MIPFQKFVVEAVKVVEDWSTQPENQHPSREYSIPRDVLFSAFMLNNERRHVGRVGFRYVVPATGVEFNEGECNGWIAAFLRNANLEAYLPTWKDYVQKRFTYHAVKKRQNELIGCTCQVGIKKKICKHMAMVKYQLKELNFPAEFRARSLDKPFVGRPRKQRQRVMRH